MRSFLPTLLLVSTLGSGTAFAQDVYRYVEKDGTIIYTNVPPTGSRQAKKMKGSFKAPARPTSNWVPRARANISYAEHIDDAAARYKIPSALVRAIMHAESAFDPTALSHKGASGLMQLMPATAEQMYVKDIFEPKDNIEGGVRYLRVLANQYDGDMVKMIAAYNAGPTAVEKYNGAIPPYAETQAYVRKVLALYYQYKSQAEQTAQSDK